MRSYQRLWALLIVLLIVFFFLGSRLAREVNPLSAAKEFGDWQLIAPYQSTALVSYSQKIKLDLDEGRWETYNLSRSRSGSLVFNRFSSAGVLERLGTLSSFLKPLKVVNSQGQPAFWAGPVYDCGGNFCLRITALNQALFLEPIADVGLKFNESDRLTSLRETKLTIDLLSIRKKLPQGCRFDLKLFSDYEVTGRNLDYSSERFVKISVPVWRKNDPGFAPQEDFQVDLVHKFRLPGEDPADALIGRAHGVLDHGDLVVDSFDIALSEELEKICAR